MKQIFDLPADWQENEKKRWLEMARVADVQKQNGKTIVLATGVFDLFHKEHQKFLQKARQAGDLLIVGIEADVRVRALKGPGRPVHDEQRRLTQVQNFEAVDYALLLPENFFRPEHHKALIALLRPDILAVSSHSEHQEKKQAILEEFGGTLKVVHEHNPSVSTTQILA